jgi:hypothetical protein
MGFLPVSTNMHLNFVKVLEVVKVKALNPNNFKHASSCVQCGSRTDKQINQRRRINGWMLDFFKAKKVISLSFGSDFVIPDYSLVS